MCHQRGRTGASHRPSVTPLLHLRYTELSLSQRRLRCDTNALLRSIDEIRHRALGELRQWPQPFSRGAKRSKTAGVSSFENEDLAKERRLPHFIGSQTVDQTLQRRPQLCPQARHVLREILSDDQHRIDPLSFCDPCQIPRFRNAVRGPGRRGAAGIAKEVLREN